MMNKNMKAEKNLKEGKRRKRAILAALISVVVMAAGITAIVFATSVNVTGVYQGTDQYSFLKPAPNATIDLDLDALNAMGAQGQPSLMSDAMKPVITENGEQQGIIAEKDNNYWWAMLDPTKTSAGKLSTDSANIFTGPLFYYTYKNAATLPDGTKANIRLTYSDLELYTARTDDGPDGGVVESRSLDQDFTGKIFVARGTNIRAYSYQSKLDNEDNNRHGIKVKANIQIVDDKGDAINTVIINGEEVPATFYFPMVDIDVIRNAQANFDALVNSTSSSSDKYATNGGYTGTGINRSFTEQYRIETAESGNVKDNNGNYIYVPGPGSNSNHSNFTLNIVSDQTGPRFYRGESDLNKTGNGDNDPGTYRTGFVSTIDNSKGITVTAWLGGGRDATVNSLICSSGNSVIVWHRIKTSTTLGGNIQTTEYGNPNGDLKNSGAVLQPGTYLVPEHRDTVYTMTPDKGYEVDEIRIGDGIKDDITQLSAVEVETLKKNGTLSVTVGGTTATESGSDSSHTYSYSKKDVTATLTYDKETGIIKLLLPDNTENHTVHVAWRQIPEAVEVTKSWDDFNDEYKTRQDVVMHIDVKSESKDGGMTVTRSMKDVLPPQLLKAGDSGEDLIKKWGNVETYETADGTTIEKKSNLPELDDQNNEILWKSIYTMNGLRYVGTSTYREVDAYENIDNSARSEKYTTFLPKTTGADDTTGDLVYYERDEDDDTIFRAYSSHEEGAQVLFTYKLHTSGIYQHTNGKLTDTKPEKLKDSDEVLEETVDNKVHTFTTKEHVVNVLPRYDQDGGEIEYIIRETLADGTTDVEGDDPSKGLVGYLTDISRYSDTNTRLNISGNPEDVETQNYTVGNTLKMITQITVDKKWIDDKKKQHTADEILKAFRLYQNGEDITDTVINSNGDPIVHHNGSKGTLYTNDDNEVIYQKIDGYEQTNPTPSGSEKYVESLPKKDHNGDKIVYSIDSDQSEGTKTYSYVYVPTGSNDPVEVKYTEKTLYKKTEDGSLSENEPTGLNKGKKYVAVVGSGDNWKYKVEDLPKYINIGGKVVPAVYLIKENDRFVNPNGRYLEPNYTSLDKAFDKNEITNTERIIVKAKKNWEDDDDSLRKDIALHIDATMKIKNGSSILSADIKDVLPA